MQLDIFSKDSLVWQMLLQAGIIKLTVIGKATLAR